MERTYDKRHCEQSGFTLIELLVVISIIALLLSVLMPSLQKAREGGKNVACKTNLKQIYLAAVLYGEENGGIIPPHFYAQGGQADDHRVWSSIVAPYIGSKEALKGEKSTYWATQGEQVLKIFKCPSQTDPFYPINYYIKYGINPVHASSYDATYTVLTKLKWLSITQPSNRLYIADSMDKRVRYLTIPSSVDRFRATGIFGNMGSYIMPYEDRRAGFIWLVSDRHNGGSNTLFLDGQVVLKKYDELMIHTSDTAGVQAQKAKMWDYRN